MNARYIPHLERDILIILAKQPANQTALFNEIDSYYGDGGKDSVQKLENLRILREKGYINGPPLSEADNEAEYELTDKGRLAVKDRLRWEKQQLKNFN